MYFHVNDKFQIINVINSCILHLLISLDITDRVRSSYFACMYSQVIMGGGRSKFLPKDFEDDQHKKGQRLDKRNLISEWLNIDRSPGSNKAYVGNRSQLEHLNVNETDYLLGKQSIIVFIIVTIMF